jgi:hypothetical protein
MSGPSPRSTIRLLAGLAMAILAAWGTPAAAQSGDEPALIQEHRADGVGLTLAVDRQEIAIDGRICLSLELTMPADRLAALPDLPDRFGTFAVVVQSPTENSSGDGTMRLRRHYELEPEGVGPLAVPPLVVAVRGPGSSGDAREIRTDPVAVTVTSVVPEGVDYTEPKDIAPPLSLPRPGLPIEAWALLGLVLAAIGVAVYVWRRRRRRTVAVRPRPAHLLALAELDRLRQAGLEDAGQVDAFYVRLSTILRRYLGWRFGLRALMQTTEEFVAGLPAAERGLAPYRPVLAALLANFDLVKFARHRPEREDTEAALSWVREFVERTGDERVLVDPAAAPRS